MDEDDYSEDTTSADNSEDTTGKEDSEAQEAKPTEDKSETFADKVAMTLKHAPVGDDGKLQLGDDVSEEVKFGVMQLKRQRDTQAAYTKARQNEVAATTAKEKLEAQLKEVAQPVLTDAQQDELDTLKHSDPDAWFEKRQKYEDAAKTKIETKITEIDTESTAASAVVQREALVSQYADTYGIELTDDIIDNQLPASYSKELADGKVDFEEFLKKSHTFLNKGKAIAGVDDGKPNTTNFGDVGGGDSSSPGDDSSTYEEEIY